MSNLDNSKCIKLVTDADFGIEPKPLNNPITRFGARGIVLRADGKMALFNKAKMNEYKLPGGGIDPGESPDVAFAREVREEVGCTVKNIKPLGYTIEEKGQTNFTQTSYVFVAEVDKNLGELSFTEKEIGEGAQIVWTTPKEALKLISGCMNGLKDSPVDKSENLYSTKFVVLRDMFILDYFIKTLNLKTTQTKK